LISDFTTGMSLEDSIQTYLDSVDAIYIPGIGVDPSPEFCVDTPSRPAPDPRRESFELALIDGARTRGMPIFAVCAGTWRLASAYGGKTAALVGDSLALNNQPTKLREDVHNISVRQGTMLAGIAKNAVEWVSDPDEDGHYQRELRHRGKAPLQQLDEKEQQNI